MLVLMLLGCYDKITIHAHLDLGANHAVGESRVVNMWENSIVCTDVATCVAALRSEASNQTAALREQGATAASVAFAIRDGELDEVSTWIFPLKNATYQHQQFLLVYDQPASGSVLDTRAIPHLGFVWQEDRSTRVSVDKAPWGSRVWTLPDQPSRHGLVLPGKRADIALTFTNLDDVGNPAHAEGWLGKYTGLEAALRAEAGLLAE